MVANGLGYTILVSRPASAMSYDGGALATRPLRDSVTPGRLILRQGEKENPVPLAGRFARHTRESLPIGASDRPTPAALHRKLAYNCSHY